MIFDLNAFHILTADIQNAVYLRIKEGSGIIMGNRLNLTLIQHETGFDQCFPIAGGAGIDDPGSIRHLGIDFLDCTDRSF